MKTAKKIGYVALGAIVLLLIPLFLMVFNVRIPDPGGEAGVLNWGVFDFIIMGLLLFGAGSVFVIATNNASIKYKIAIGATVLVLFLLAWAELAVGIF